MLGNWIAGEKSLWLRFFIPYMAVLIVPLGIGIIFYNQTYQVISTEAANSNLMVLNQGKQMLDRRLAEVESMVQQISMDSNVLSYQTISEPFSGVNPMRALETKKAISQFGRNNNFITDFMVFYRNSDVAISPSRVYDFSKMYGYNLAYEQMDAESWSRLVVDEYHNRHYLPAMEVDLNGRSRQMVTYLHSLGMPSHYQGTVAVMIDNQEIRRLLQGLNIDDGGWAYITDQSGNVITSIASDAAGVKPMNLALNGSEGFKSDTIDSQPMSVTYTTSAYNGWQYVAVQPSHVVMSKAYYIKRITLVLFAAFLVIGLLIALYLSYRNSQPVRALVTRIADSMSYEPGPKDAYGFIETTFARLKSNNEQLTTELEAQKPLLRATFFERLLKGGFIKRSEIEVSQRHIQINLIGNYYTVAILQLQDDGSIEDEDLLEELDIQRVVAKDVIRSASEPEPFFHDIGDNKFAVLYVADAGDERTGGELVRMSLERSAAKLKQQFRAGFQITAGGTYGDLLQVSQSFEEANRALNSGVGTSDSAIIWHAELPQAGDHYYYPGDVENRLVNLVKAGNQIEAREILLQLHQWNFDDRQLSGYMFKLFLHELLGSFIKIAEGAAAVKEEINAFVQSMVGEEQLHDQQAVFETLFHQLLGICKTIEQQKKSHNHQLIDGIMEYLQTHYSDEMLNLSAVADEFHISEMYLSQFFKEQTGVNFSAYVEERRMDQAKKLLVQGKHSVADIAGMVGYSSSNTFCRAFKRIHAMTPLAYRKNAANRQEILISQDRSGLY